MSAAADRLRATLEGSDMATGGPAIFNTADLREVLKELTRKDTALAECHKEIFNLRDAMLSTVVPT